MKALKLRFNEFRQFKDCEIVIGNRITAIAGNNGTGKSTVLGLLANSSQLSGYKTYIGRPYRGEFSELFAATPKHDPKGSNRLELEYIEHGTLMTASFRTAWQDGGNRYRIIPKRMNAEGKSTESKITSPVIYLGLSRLYPIGEAENGHHSEHRLSWAQKEDENWFIKNYSYILSIATDIKSTSTLDIENLSKKRGTGIETEVYGPASNSAGQDNLGQILMSILSFKKLARDMGDSWDGGLLLIDELDATLHPAAQSRLIDLLEDESKKTGFQAVFTTHSASILEELSKKNQYNHSERPGDIEVAYLTDANGFLQVKRNPSVRIIKSDLSVKPVASLMPKVGVFSEDAEARWFAMSILEACEWEHLQHVDFIEASFGCDQLIRLYTCDFAYLRDRIVLFDGDVSDEKIDSIPKGLADAGSNIVRLPGPGRPESVIYDFLSNLQPESDLLPRFELHGITLRVLKEGGPNSPTYAGQADERNKYKQWLRDYMAAIDKSGAIKAWTQANEEAANDFVRKFDRAFKKVSKRLGLPA